MGVHLLSWQILDSGGNTKTMVYPMADTESLTDIQTFVTNHAPLLDAVIHGTINKVSVQLALTLPGGLNGTPADDRPVTHGAILGFDVNDTSYKYSIYLPTCHDDFLANGGALLNSGAMATYITDILSGTEVTITNKHEQTFAAFLSGKQVDRK